MTMVAHLKTTTKLGELVSTKQFDKYLIRYPPWVLEFSIWISKYWHSLNPGVWTTWTASWRWTWMSLQHWPSLDFSTVSSESDSARNVHFCWIILTARNTLVQDDDAEDEEASSGRERWLGAILRALMGPESNGREPFQFVSSWSSSSSWFWSIFDQDRRGKFDTSLTCYFAPFLLWSSQGGCNPIPLIAPQCYIHLRFFTKCHLSNDP